MRLRSLEVQGFKSFPDKTKLEFGGGITAVVGPNGSGKSNIADAVRWVLGEQSTKTLRGGKMEDVIFGGTQTRNAVGYASVQLVIDNTDKVLPDRENEISIMRRLYRSGESEYRINGAMVRLKDIHEMLMDTGLGRDGYSIIGQGRISEIVSAKSKERREIFEEAAGIAKYRYRKVEAERKLAQSEENFVRLRDILDELESRVGPLKQQAEKAREFLGLAQERKELEISLWMISLDEIKAKLAEQENKADICKNRYEQFEREGEEVENKINEIYEQSVQLDIQMESKRAQIKAFEERLAKYEADIAVCRNDIQHNETSVMRIAEELSSSDTGADTLKESLGNAALKEQESTAELCAMEQKITAAEERLLQQREQIEKVLAEIEEISFRKASTERAAAEIRLENAASASVRAESAARLEEIKHNNALHDSNMESLKQAVEECGIRIEELDDNVKALENSQKGYALKKDSRKARLDSIHSKIEEKENEAVQKLQRARLLEDLENNMEGFSGSIKYILSQAAKGAVPGVFGVLSSIISTDEKYNTAIETALGPAVQNIVVEDEATAKRCIRMLQNARAGRGTFLPLTTVKGKKTNPADFGKHDGFIGIASDLITCDSRFRGIIEQILGRVVIAEDMDSASEIAKSTGYRTRAVTLDGQVVNAGGSYTGGSNVRSAGVLGRKNEIDRLKNEAAEIKEQSQSLQPELKAAAEEISAIDASISGILSELQTAREEKVRLAVQRENLQKNLAQAEENQKLAARELEVLVKKLESLRSDEASQKTVLEEMDMQAEQMAEKLTLAYSRRDALILGAETTAGSINEQRMAFLAADKDRESLAQEIARLHEQIENAGTRTQRLEDEKAELENQNNLILLRIENIEKEKTAAQDDVKLFGEAVEAFIAKRTDMEKETTALRKQERELSADRESLSKDIARLEERRHAVQSEYDSIITKLWDEYELTKSQAAQAAVKIENTDTASRRLGELRSRIKQLGSVNVGAIDEFAEVNERYTFLSAQVKDAENAKAQLEKLIGELTGEMREIFAENFAKIADNFSKVFVQLFGGGKASLTMADESDVLESGIDIAVQPPGKVIKNLSLLSGGEQAFVAIAIYFAIQKVKPSPFCLLDEIEAALDDVNVTRFAAYLRQMCEKTQFIAITHRRGTMEEADVLYGVTMQEEGVSKLLELKVAEVESRLGI